MNERKKIPMQEVSLLLKTASVRLTTELDKFFDGNTSDKVKSLNNVLNAFINESNGHRFANENYVPDTVFHITSIVDFLSTCSDVWANMKQSETTISKHSQIKK